jgi:hypothetical protein
MVVKSWLYGTILPEL